MRKKSKAQWRVEELERDLLFRIDCLARRACEAARKEIGQSDTFARGLFVGEAWAFSNAASMLATDLKIASWAWDKPKGYKPDPKL